MPLILTAISVWLLIGFFSIAGIEIVNFLHTAIFDKRLDFNNTFLFDFKYLMLFSILGFLALSDSIFERIGLFLSIFLVLLGFAFAVLSGIHILRVLELFSLGSGILVFFNVIKLGSYAFGDILCAGAIGLFVGLIHIAIIVALSVIAAAIVFNIVNMLLRKKEIFFHMAFVPFLLFSTALIFYFGGIK